MAPAPFKLVDLLADETYLAACLAQHDWFNIMFYVLGNDQRAAILRKLLKANDKLPVPKEQITPFLATCGFCPAALKCVFSKGWFHSMHPDTLANFYTYNEWVAAQLDEHICEATLHCTLFAYMLTDVRAVRHYLQVRSRLPIDLKCALCRQTQEHALQALQDANLERFDRFTVQELRGLRVLLTGRPNAAIEEKLRQLLVEIIP